MAAGWQRARRVWSHSELIRDTVLAVAVFMLSLALVAASLREADHRAGPTWAVVALTAATALPLAARRQSPLAVFVFTAMASAALRGISEPPGPAVGPTVALYFLAADGVTSRSQGRLIVALAALALLAHAVAMSINETAPVATALGFGVVVWGAAWLVGDRTRLRREKLRELQQRALRLQHEAERERRLAVAEERTRIARDLHDSAGHALNVILMHAGLGRLQAGEQATPIRETFSVIEDVARQTVTEIEHLVGALRDTSAQPEVEPPPGLAALETLVDRHQATGLDVAIRIHGSQRELPPIVDRSAYRILQEALTNAARHGNGHATVELTYIHDAVQLRVVNPVRSGAGSSEARGGHGVVGMRERAALLGGSLRTAVEGERFHLDVRLPFPHRAT